MRKKPDCIGALMAVGISFDDAATLRRASMTLQSWFEQECGNSNDFCSWSIVRGNKTADGFVYDDDGKPFEEQHFHRHSRTMYVPRVDREKGARKRIADVIARYPGFGFYIQTDPRGCALYVLRPGDIAAGADPSTCYTRGLAVHK
jgi:hypothetical protein